MQSNGAKETYDEMPLIFDRCWGCGRTERDRPLWWFAPFLVERAHFVNKPRRQDRRVVVMLCSLCHRKQHGERFPEDVEGLPPLTLAGMLYLKSLRDPEFFEPEFAQQCSIKRIPAPEVPGEHIQAFAKRG